MMTSAQIRQSYLDFFREQQHTVVPSSSLLPDSPNLLFTNAGMNQFVPIFLGERQPDVSKWAGALPGSDTRAADTQKCIRAGGKHNDLEDVGIDTYHHTFFEMLGNWSFGDYFKKEAIEWAWELVVNRWGFPPARLYATIYQPGPGDPAERDEEAWGYWAAKFRSVGLDPALHIVNGNKKDNFWMMGETGPCGPCSELHVDLTPQGDTQGRLVNQGSPECIEIWNLVFIQFNANVGGTFSPLPAQHVDTGMGFERVTSIIQGTKGFTDFENAKISNYETDVFRPIFDELEKMSGRKYASTLPLPNAQGVVVPTNEQEAIDIAFRVIADHIRTLSFAIAAGIQPGNSDRQYVLRRILRRAVKYGRNLGFKEPFFYKLVDVLAKHMGEVFPELRAKGPLVKETLKREEEAFNRTLDTGIELFGKIASFHVNIREAATQILNNPSQTQMTEGFERDAALLKIQRAVAAIGREEAQAAASADEWKLVTLAEKQEDQTKKGRSVGMPLSTTSVLGFEDTAQLVTSAASVISGSAAFKLYDTYGFPLDLTELMARERGLTVDVAGFEKHMEEQRARARAAQKKTVIELSEIETKEPTHFLGYDHDHTDADVAEVLNVKGKAAVILNNSVLYAEMGGQVGDTGELSGSGQLWRVANTQKSGHTFLHFLEGAGEAPTVGDHVTVQFDKSRRAAIQRHHTVTHLLHWALHEVVSHEATQKGSFVGPEKLTFDFNGSAVMPEQLREIERLVNERIVENAPVTWTEVPYADVRSRGDIMQAFGDKYGEQVRVVQVGGEGAALNGYSMELCGGTHVRHTGEIGLFRIVSEGAVAAGVRRIEAVAGLAAREQAVADTERLRQLAATLGSPLGELEKKLAAFLAHQKELERQLDSLRKKQAANTAARLVELSHPLGGTPAIVEKIDEATGDELQSIADALKAAGYKGVVFLLGTGGGQVALMASVPPEFTVRHPAGKLIQAAAVVVGGKGGGRPDSARGAGKDVARVPDAMLMIRTLLAGA